MVLVLGDISVHAIEGPKLADDSGVLPVVQDLQFYANRVQHQLF